MRLINADELLTAFPVDDEPMLTKSCVRMTIQHMPTVNAVTVVHGRWLDGYRFQICSSCKYRGKKSWKFCPNCGAKMDGKDGEQK